MSILSYGSLGQVSIINVFKHRIKSMFYRKIKDKIRS